MSKATLLLLALFVSATPSAQQSRITGQLIAVDGGASLMDRFMPLAIQQPELQPA